MLICVSIILDKTSLPFFTIDTDVSSQLDSIPHYKYVFHIIVSPQSHMNIPNIAATNEYIPVETKLITGAII